MPESYQRGFIHPAVRAKMHTLAKADENGQLLKVRCALCSVSHFYRPSDLVQLFGEVTILDLDGRFRCSRCGSRDGINLTYINPSAAERMKMTVRHLVKVRSIKVPVWKDVRGGGDG
ncbi:hypothetical protein IB238_23620 [Rhizobium sp. ARZ01]|uniref:hypothetical protein n=1 Tax=Rhizobium sp. ARZ01 TaxID=2769313 RepID=UPI001786DB48|nr:hypothetical protein [Rhizobium sp. ARZ01]MBD9375601.1 hypothetical protein [Rhizobium sp. ARZ01]